MIQNSSKQKEKIIHQFSLIVFFFLSVLSLHHYEVRTLSFDAAFQIFGLIINNDLFIQVGRFGAASVQALPLIARKLNWSLESILQLYSISFVLVPFILYAVSYWVLKQRRFAFMIALYMILFTSHSFYWIQSELIQACYWIIFFYAWYTSQIKPVLIYWTVSFLLLVTAIYFHPLAPIPLSFGAAYLFLTPYQLSKRKLIILGGAILLVLIYKMFFGQQYAYDQSSMSHANTILTKPLQYFDLTSTRMWRNQWLTNYLAYPIVLTLMLLGIWKNENRWKFTFTVLSCFAYLYLVNKSYHWRSPLFHMESFYQVVAMMLIFPITYDLLPKIRSGKALSILLGLWLCFRIVLIILAGNTYTKRYDFIGDLLHSESMSQGQNYYTKETAYLQDQLILPWSVPYETLLRTAMVGEDKCKTLTVVKDMKKFEGLNGKRKKHFRTLYGSIPFSELPAQYFYFDDMGSYKKIKNIYE